MVSLRRWYLRTILLSNGSWPAGTPRTRGTATSIVPDPKVSLRGVLPLR